MFLFVFFNSQRQYFQFIPFRRSGNGIEYFFQTRQRLLIIGFGFDGFDIHCHLFFTTSRKLLHSIPATNNIYPAKTANFTPQLSAHFSYIQNPSNVAVSR